MVSWVQVRQLGWVHNCSLWFPVPFEQHESMQYFLLAEELRSKDNYDNNIHRSEVGGHYEASPQLLWKELGSRSLAQFPGLVNAQNFLG